MNTLGLMMKTFLVLATATILVSVALPSALAQTETVLYSFNDIDGYYPYGGLVRDTEGNLYGTTESGGAAGVCGIVFKLTPSNSEVILHAFRENTTDGCQPEGSLVRDTEGNLYGTTYAGGDYEYGTVFKLTPSGTETVLHSFGVNGADGYEPVAGLALDTKGNLYGTTPYGGAYGYGEHCLGFGCGTVFELTPSGTETILHSFGGTAADGQQPEAPVILDMEGNLYGTTSDGGAYRDGTVFELTPSGTETILHSFYRDGGDGESPQAGLVRDAEGNLYGTTNYGGPGGGGTAFELTPSGTETILCNFKERGPDGSYPEAGLALDTIGNLYGTTTTGGANRCGTVFELTPSGTLTILHSFCANATDGSDPQAGLVLDAEGNLYGTTTEGGAYGDGTVFEVKP